MNRLRFNIDMRELASGITYFKGKIIGIFNLLYNFIFKMNSSLYRHWIAILLFFFVFFIGIFWNINLPGLYMDEVNPDYLVSWLFSGGSIYVWLLPSNGMLPALGQLYHGLLHTYTELPIFSVFGTSLSLLRLIHAFFGFLILLFGYFFLIKLTKNFWVSFIPILFLATDSAFVYAFRTQGYITIAPLVLLLFSFLFLLYLSDLRKERKEKFSIILIFSGIFFGLAFYGYFIYIFFLPALIFFLLKMNTGVFSDRKVMLFWMVGFLIGVTPYFYGYANLFIGWGGISGFSDNLNKTLLSLNVFPQDVSQSMGGIVIGYIWEALSNNFSNRVVFHGQASLLSGIKVFVLGIFIIVTFFVSFVRRHERMVKFFQWYFIFIISYIGGALVFSSRLGAHHMLLFVPMIYIGLGFSLLEWFSGISGKGLAKRSVLNIFVLLIFFVFIGFSNIFEQVRFQSLLRMTGGVGLYSDSINYFIDGALRKNPKQIVYAFPEWGFFMQFAFLTEGKMPYVVVYDEKSIKKILCGGKYVSIVRWLKNENFNSEIFEDLDNLGIPSEKEIYYQRDGRPIFYEKIFSPLNNCSL